MKHPQFLEEWIDGATICRESSAVGFVWSFYETCLNFFANLVPLVSKAIPAASAKVVLNEEVGRLLSWGDGFGNGELDRTLDRDMELKSTALEYLSGLGTALADGLFVTPVLNGLKGGAELEKQAFAIRSMVNNARTIIDRSEDDESDIESDIGIRFADTNAIIDDIASDISFYSLRLMDLLPSIERTALLPKDMPGSKEASKSISSVQFQVSEPAIAYVRQIRDKYPNADEKLIERLGEANWQRRLRIREDPVGAIESAVIDASKSFFLPVSMFQDSGLGRSIQTQSAYAPTAASHSSFRTTATENQAGNYRVPPTPREVYAGKPFACEICGRVLMKIKNRMDWKIHVFADLKPYICTFSSCTENLCTFPTRQQWADHEFRKHRMEKNTKTWRCFQCLAQFPSLPLWDDHIREQHGTVFSKESHRKALAVAGSFEEHSIESETCPMCLKSGMATRKAFVTHVARHMENIALAALPRDADTDSEPDSKSDSEAPSKSTYKGFQIVSAPNSSDFNQDTMESVSTGRDLYINGPEPSNSAYKSLGHSDSSGFQLSSNLMQGYEAQQDLSQQSAAFRSPARVGTAYDTQPTEDNGGSLPGLIAVRNPALSKPQKISSYWKNSERTDFPTLVQHYGSDWHAIATQMGSKSHIMVKNYYQRQIDGGYSELEELVRIADEQKARKDLTGPSQRPSISTKRNHSPRPLKKSSQVTMTAVGAETVNYQIPLPNPSIPAQQQQPPPPPPQPLVGMQQQQKIPQANRPAAGQPQLTAQEIAMVNQMTRRLFQNASEEERNNVRHNMPTKTDQANLLRYQASGMDLAMLYYQNQAMDYLKKANFDHGKIQNPRIIQEMNGNVNITSGTPTEKQMSSNSRAMNDQGQQPPHMQANQSLESIPGSLETLAGYRQHQQAAVPLEDAAQPQKQQRHRTRQVASKLELHMRAEHPTANPEEIKLYVADAANQFQLAHQGPLEHVTSRSGDILSDNHRASTQTFGAEQQSAKAAANRQSVDIPHPGYLSDHLSDRPINALKESITLGTQQEERGSVIYPLTDHRLAGDSSVDNTDDSFPHVLACHSCSSENKDDLVLCTRCKTHYHTYCVGLQEILEDYLCANCVLLPASPSWSMFLRIQSPIPDYFGYNTGHSFPDRGLGSVTQVSGDLSEDAFVREGSRNTNSVDQTATGRREYNSLAVLADVAPSVRNYDTSLIQPSITPSQRPPKTPTGAPELFTCDIPGCVASSFQTDYLLYCHRREKHHNLRRLY